MTTKLIKLPADITIALDALARRTRDTGRPYTLDGHSLGSLGEDLAKEIYGIELKTPSTKHHDATCQTRGEVEIKITGLTGKSVGLRGPYSHLIVFKLVSHEEAEVVYDGSGIGIWETASNGKTPSNGQRTIRIAKLRALTQ